MVTKLGSLIKWVKVVFEVGIEVIILECRSFCGCLLRRFHGLVEVLRDY